MKTRHGNSVSGSVARRDGLQKKIETLKARLREAEELVRAFKIGEVALQGTEHAYRAMVETMNEGAATLTADGVVLYCNRRLVELLKQKMEHVIGARLREFLAPSDVAKFDALMQQSPRVSARDRFQLRRTDGELIPVYLALSDLLTAESHSVVLMVTDFTELSQAEQALQRSIRAHRAVSGCNQVLMRATEESELLREICRVIVEEAGYRLCSVGYASQDSGSSVQIVAQSGKDDGYLAVANITWADSALGRGPTGTCIRTGERQIVTNIATDPAMAPWRAEALRRGYASIIAIPLSDGAKTFGALTIYSAHSTTLGEEELTLLTELAGDMSYGIVSLRTRGERVKAAAEVLEHEHEVAIGFKIQQILLLGAPPQDIPGLSVAALSLPSRRISGDFYHFFTHQGTSLDVIIADVMGNGIPAALLGAATKSHFTQALCRLMALSPTHALPQPREILTLVQAGMARHLIELEIFVTLCYARLDRTRRHIDILDCGHTGVIHLRHGADRCETIRGNNLPLGVQAVEIYEQLTVPFDTGDLFVFFSDGITEAPNAARERFGIERLMACVRMNRNLAPEALLGALHTAVVVFSGSDRLADDLTCVVIAVGETQHPLTRQELDIRSDLADLSRAREFVCAFCQSLPGSPMSEEQVAELELAVNEAASNIMIHAHHGRADLPIHLEGDAFADHLEIRLHHLGDPFDPAVVPAPSFDGSRESGFGVYVMSRSTDSVRYYRDERGRNCIALVKTLKSSKCGTTR